MANRPACIEIFQCCEEKTDKKTYENFKKYNCNVRVKEVLQQY